MGTWYRCPQRSDDIGCPGAGVYRQLWATRHGDQGPSLGPLQQQYILLATNHLSGSSDAGLLFTYLFAQIHEFSNICVCLLGCLLSKFMIFQSSNYIQSTSHLQLLFLICDLSFHPLENVFQISIKFWLYPNYFKVIIIFMYADIHIINGGDLFDFA